MIKLRCRLRFHDWKKWTSTPITGADTKGWYAGQVRQCSDCWIIEARTVGESFAYNLRPLRDAVRDHIEDLKRCMNVIAESEYSTEFDATRKEIGVAVDELSEALAIDEGHVQKIKAA